jgi:YegS/Rv2252/BmrU family lipid kinase
MRRVKVEVILNAGSGGSANSGAQQRLVDLFSAGGVEAQISVAETGAEIVELARKAAKSDVDIVAAAGGDGTINAVAAAVIESHKSLGILPCGTLNHLAKDLGIPLDLEAAAQTIIEGHKTAIDVGQVNDRIFLNNSSLGLYPSLVRERQKRQQLGWGKWPAFVWAAIAVLRRYPFLGVRLNVDGKEMVSRTPFVFIGNNEYEMETLQVGSRRALDGGSLSIYVTRRIGRWGLARLALRAMFGGLRQEKDFMAAKAEQVWIESKHRRLRVALDGEITIMQTPLHYQIRPRALRVIVPEEEMHERIANQ